MINTKLLHTSLALFLTAITVTFLIVSKNFLLPIVSAIIICYVVFALTAACQHIPGTTVRLPFTLSVLLATCLTGLAGYFLISLVSISINGIIEDVPLYQQKMISIFNYFTSLLPIHLHLQDVIQKIDLGTFFANMAYFVTYITGHISLILIYVIFLLLEYNLFREKIRKIIHGKNEKGKYILEKIHLDINHYLKAKMIVSFITAIASYVVLKFFKITHSEFWACLIFILNFIPTIGSAVAVLMTLLGASIVVSTLTQFYVLAIFLVSIQLIMGSVVEPKWLGKSLNLSPFVILISLSFWGSIWGITGMFLSIPLMTILNIIFSKFESTYFLSILLSADPKLIK